MEITERTVDTVTILDLSGRLTIREGAQLLKDKSESLVFQGRSSVIDLLSITKLVSVFDTFDTEQEAIASYSATRQPESFAR